MKIQSPVQDKTETTYGMKEPLIFEHWEPYWRKKCSVKSMLQFPLQCPRSDLCLIFGWVQTWVENICSIPWVLKHRGHQNQTRIRAHPSSPPPPGSVKKCRQWDRNRESDSFLRLEKSAWAAPTLMFQQAARPERPSLCSARLSASNGVYAWPLCVDL